MKVPFLDLGRAYEVVAEQADPALAEIARSGQYILGKNVTELERSVAEYLGTAHAIAVGSGTDALHLALAGLQVGPGDEVITTPFTFAATVEAIEYVGAQPVLVDIDANTWNIDVAKLEAAITDRTRAVIPVHLLGRPADMTAVMDVAARHDLLVVEDCAQSFGSAIGDRRAGSFGHANAFSFYPTKTLGGLGDGGMISTDDPEVDRRIRELRNHGIGQGGEHTMLGFNSRLDELQAAVILLKLANIDDMNKRRREIAARYTAALADTPATTPVAETDGAYHVHGYYTILVDDRDSFRAQLAEKGVASAIYYPKPLHQHEYFANTCRTESLEVAERTAPRCVSLPIFPEMSDEEIDYVASTSADLLS